MTNTHDQLDAQLAGRPALVVIPCSGSKLWHKAPAGELYTGSWHKLARSTADALVERHGGRVLILSALHGLLTLDQIVEPYDLMMRDAGSINANALALQLLHQLDGDLLDALAHDGQVPDVVALLPRAYRERLLSAVEQLPASSRPGVHTPLAGAPGVGVQRQLLAQLRDAAAAVPA